MILTFVTKTTISLQKAAVKFSFEYISLIKGGILIISHQKRFSFEVFKFVRSMIFVNNIRMTVNAAFPFFKKE